MFFSLIYSICKGITLGGSLVLLGHILDYTINFEHENRIIKEKPDFYCLGHKYILINLLVLTPLTYGLVDILLLCHNYSFSFNKYAGVLLTQNIGYYFVQKEIYRNKDFFPYHKRIHKLNTHLFPYLDNMVSPTEFCIAYMFPLFLGSFLFRPTELTYICAISTLGISKLLYITNERKDFHHVPNIEPPKKKNINEHDARIVSCIEKEKDKDALCEHVIINA